MNLLKIFYKHFFKYDEKHKKLDINFNNLNDYSITYSKNFKVYI